MRRSISFNMIVALLSRLAVGGISLVITAILTRSLGPINYGYYNALLAYLFLFATLADFGLYTILIKELGQAQQDEGTIVSELFTLRLVIVVGAAILANILGLWLPYPHEVRIALLFASFYLVSSSMVQILNGVFQKHLRLTSLAISDVVARVVQLALLVVFLYLGINLITFVIIMVLSEILRFILVMIFARPLVNIKLSFNFKYWKRILKTAFPIATSLIFVLLYFKLDTFILSLMKSAHDVGVYSVGYKVLEAIIFLPATYIGLVMPLLSRYAFRDKRLFKAVFERAFKILAIFAMPAGIYLYILAPYVVRIIGGVEFGQSAEVLSILSLAIVAIFFGNLGGNAVIALDLQRKSLWIYFCGAILNIIANLILIPRFSYIATSWTTVMTELFVTFSLFFLVRQSVEFGKYIGTILKLLLAGFIMFALVSYASQSLILACLTTLIYFPLLYVLRIFTKDDLKDILNFKAPLAIYGEAENLE